MAFYKKYYVGETKYLLTIFPVKYYFRNVEYVPFFTLQKRREKSFGRFYHLNINKV